MWQAVQAGDAGRVAALLARGQRTSSLRTSTGVTPLAIAVRRGDLQIARLLVDDDPAAARVTTTSGASLLHAAVFEDGIVASDAARALEMIELLLARGAPTEAQTNGETALAVAVRTHADIDDRAAHAELVGTLLNATMAACRKAACRTAHARHGYFLASATLHAHLQERAPQEREHHAQPQGCERALLIV